MTNYAILVFSIIMLISCNSNKAYQANITETEQNISSLPDSLIPSSIRELSLSLEKNNVKIDCINYSKWSLFGEDGFWIKTDKGSADIVPIPKHIDQSKIKVTEDSSNSIIVHEISYMGKLEQSIQGKLSYVSISGDLISKTFDKELHNQILKFE